VNNVLNGFASELTKVALAKGLGRVGKFMMKHPVAGIMVPIIGATSIAAGTQAYKSGKSGGRGRYLKASPRGASKSAYTNYHGLMKHRASKKDIKKITGKYRESAFSRRGPSSKSKKA